VIPLQDKAELLASIAQVGFEQLTDEAGRAMCRHDNDPRKQFVAASVQYILFGVRNPRIAHLLFGGEINIADRPARPEAVILGRFSTARNHYQ
jgi:hypothetical protein